MSHFCTNINCPNRKTTGRENDEDVINIICPKCERLLFVSQNRKEKLNKYRKRLIVSTLIILISSSLYFYREEIQNIVKNDVNPSKNNPTQIEKLDTVTPDTTLKEDSSNPEKEIKKDKNKESIKSLLLSEDRRDFEEIKTFYADNIVRYWNVKNITKIELEEQYKNSWKKSSYSKNAIENIRKIDNNSYIIQTEFTFYHIKKDQEVTVLSKVKFVFDQNGKIIKNYGIN